MKKVDILNEIASIIKDGNLRDDRTGVGTYSCFGRQFRYNLRDETFPLLTTKRVFFRGVAEELFWIIRGCTDSKKLAEKNVHIWDANGSREFLDNLGFTDRREGDLGPVYGFQWRHFGAKYNGPDADYSGQGVDQLQDVIDKIRKKPYDRRIIMSAWNPSDLSKMALRLVTLSFNSTSLTKNYHVNSIKDQPTWAWAFLSTLASYSLLTIMIAHICELKPGEFVHTIGDCHVYTNHVEGLQEQLKREPRPFPKIRVKGKVANIEDFKLDDFELEGYKPYPKIALEMAV